MNKKTILFSEIQYFRIWWLWFTLIAVNTLLLYGCYKQLFLGNPFGDKPAPDNILIVLFILTLALTAFFWFMRLETRIEPDGISTRFFPLSGYKKRTWPTIQSLHTRTYSPIQEYGGWGIRGLGNNRALNVSGNQGLQLILHSGEKLLIGTKKPQEIDKILRGIPELAEKHTQTR